MALPLERVKKRAFYFFFTLFGGQDMRNYGKIYEAKGFEVREKTLKTWEKTRIYQEIRRYGSNGKNIICMPRQGMNSDAWMQKIKASYVRDG